MDKCIKIGFLFIVRNFNFIKIYCCFVFAHLPVKGFVGRYSRIVNRNPDHTTGTINNPVISSYLSDNSSNTNNIGTGYRSTVNSKEIGIRLKVKPLIGQDGSVQLEIEQDVKDVLGEVTIDGNPQPRVGSRTTQSFVSVHSGDIIVLGGLQRETQTKSTSRLGPIPIIGDLFGSRSRSKTRTDLVFFLRPTILTNSADDNARAMKQVEEFPELQRDKVKSVLEPAGSSLHGNGN